MLPSKTQSVRHARAAPLDRHAGGAADEAAGVVEGRAGSGGRNRARRAEVADGGADDASERRAALRGAGECHVERTAVAVERAAERMAGGSGGDGDGTDVGVEAVVVGGAEAEGDVGGEGVPVGDGGDPPGVGGGAGAGKDGGGGDGAFVDAQLGEVEEVVVVAVVRADEDVAACGGAVGVAPGEGAAFVVEDVRAVEVDVGDALAEREGDGRPLVGRDVPVGGRDARAGGLVELLEVDVAGALLEVDQRVGVVRGRHVEEAAPPDRVGDADPHHDGVGAAGGGRERSGDRDGEVLAVRDRHGAVAGGEAGEEGGVRDGGDLADALDGRRGRGADDGVRADRGAEQVRAAVSGVVERESGEQVPRRGPGGRDGEEQGGEEESVSFHGRLSG